MLQWRPPTSIASAAVRRLGGVLLIVAVWQALVWTHWWSDALLPAPIEVGSALARMSATGELLSNTSASVGRVVLGIAIGTLAGIVTGYAASSRGPVGAALRQVVELLRPIPPIAWIPLAILWFGIGSSAAIAVVFVGVFFPFTISCADAIARSRSAVAEVVALYGIRGRQAVQMEFPAALPEIATGLRLAIGLGWASVIASELVSAQAGLGYLIQESRLLLQMDRVIACMAMIGAIGFALSLIARRVERSLLRKFRTDLA